MYFNGVVIHLHFLSCEFKAMKWERKKNKRLIDVMLP